jgi:peptidoglycan biosynthesis protein MviN/MurJ (putative lipid II flippase)
VLASLVIILPIWLLLVHKFTPWLASGFLPEKQKALEMALLWLVPYYFLNGMNMLSYGVMQANRRYLINGLLPLIMPMLTIFILLYSGSTSDWRTLAAALAVGSTAECAVLIVIIHRGNQLCIPRWHEMAERLKPIFRASLALLPTYFVVSVGSIVEQSVNDRSNRATGDRRNGAT